MTAPRSSSSSTRGAPAPSARPWRVIDRPTLARMPRCHRHRGRGQAAACRHRDHTPTASRQHEPVRRPAELLEVVHRQSPSAISSAETGLSARNLRGPRRAPAPRRPWRAGIARPSRTRLSGPRRRGVGRHSRHLGTAGGQARTDDEDAPAGAGTAHEPAATRSCRYDAHRHAGQGGQQSPRRRMQRRRGRHHHRPSRRAATNGPSSACSSRGPTRRATRGGHGPPAGARTARHRPPRPRPGAAHDVRPHPAAGHHDGRTDHRSRPAPPTTLTDLVDETADIEACPAAAVSAEAPTSRRRCWIAFCEPGPPQLEQDDRLVAVAGFGQASVVGAQPAQQPGAARRRPVVAARAGSARWPPPLAPPQQHPRAGEPTARASAGRTTSSPRMEARARSSVLPNVARWWSSASSPRRQACHIPRTSSRCSRPSPSASHAVARTSPEGWRRYFAASAHSSAAVWGADVGRGPAGQQPGHRGVLRAERLELARQPFGRGRQRRSSGTGTPASRERRKTPLSRSPRPVLGVGSCRVRPGPRPEVPGRRPGPAPRTTG